MYLKRLEIQGFKSFARKTVMEYETGVTSIVGPNGSGKSNVADALRWVLGEQSAKLMRGKKSDDVIFAGSDKKVRLNFAEVNATFDNLDRRIPVDASEVSIGRRIDRSGESEYLINGNRVRLLDIVDLVLKSSIGTSRYTVIGQGTIDQMVLAGPSEIKNLIDEASGVKTYFIKRDKTLKRLEQTAQNLMRAEDLISELEPRVKSLRRLAKKMEAREEVQGQLRVYEKEHLGSLFWELSKKIEICQEKLKSLDQQRKNVEQAIYIYQDKLDKHDRENLQEAEQAAKQQIKLQQLLDQKNRLTERASMIRGTMQSQRSGDRSDPTSLQVAYHASYQKLQDCKSQFSKIEVEINNHRIEQKQYIDQLSQITEKLDALYQSLSNPAQSDWHSLKVELEKLDNSFNRFCEGMDLLIDIDSARNLVHALREQWQLFQSSAHRLVISPQDNYNNLQEELRNLTKQKELLAATETAASLRISNQSVARDFLKQQISDLEQEVLQLDLELKKVNSNSTDEYIAQLASQENEVRKEIEVLEKSILEVEAGLQNFVATENQWRLQLAEEDKNFRARQQHLSAIRDQESVLQVEQARHETNLESVVQDIFSALGEQALADIKKQEIVSTTSGLIDIINKLKHQLELIGGVDDLTIQEYHETESRYASLTEQVSDLHKAMTDLRSVIDELDSHIKKEFQTAFEKVNQQFEQYFRLLFNGGRAYLSLLKGVDVDEEEKDETSDDQSDGLRPEQKIVAKYEQGVSNIIGVDIKATPPGKKLASIQALSGGERALTSIALLCSLLACFPSPFVVLDEVDAALDEANTIRFGQILGTLAHQTQFITITHNRETMAQSNTLYGVTMGDDGISKLLGIKMDQAATYAK